MRYALRTIAFVVPAWNDALLLVERDGMKEIHQLDITWDDARDLASLSRQEGAKTAVEIINSKSIR